MCHSGATCAPRQVLRDPVDRTHSDFRFFFHSGTGDGLDNRAFRNCPKWWPGPHSSDLRNPARRFHEVCGR